MDTSKVFDFLKGAYNILINMVENEKERINRNEEFRARHMDDDELKSEYEKLNRYCENSEDVNYGIRMRLSKERDELERRNLQ